MATLKFVKQTKLANNLYPFFAHVDFSLISKQDNINLQITKLSNGLIRFESQKFQVYTSAIKSGCRHVDEKAKISTKVILDSWLDVVDADAGVKLKESKVKATFKIEINDEEKKVKEEAFIFFKNSGCKLVKCHDWKRPELGHFEVDDEYARRSECGCGFPVCLLI